MSPQDEGPNLITLEGVSHTRIGRSRYLDSYNGPKKCCKPPFRGRYHSGKWKRVVSWPRFIYILI